MKALGTDNKRLQQQHTAVAPRYSDDELLGIASSDPRQPFAIEEVIARIVDASEFLPFKNNYSKNLICGFANIAGFPVGIVANNGILFLNVH